MKITLKIEVSGKEIELTEAEASELLTKLKALKGEPETVFIPYVQTIRTYPTTAPVFPEYPQIWCSTAIG